MCVYVCVGVCVCVRERERGRPLEGGSLQDLVQESETDKNSDHDK